MSTASSSSSATSSSSRDLLPKYNPATETGPKLGITGEPIPGVADSIGAIREAVVGFTACTIRHAKNAAAEVDALTTEAARSVSTVRNTLDVWKSDHPYVFPSLLIGAGALTGAALGWRIGKVAAVRMGVVSAAGAAVLVYPAQSVYLAMQTRDAVRKFVDENAPKW